MLASAMSILRWLLLFFLLAAATGCGEGEAGGAPTFGRVARTNGSAVALSRDERIAVALNRSAGIATIFSLNPELGSADMITGSKVLDLGEGSEPWAAVIGGDDDTAFVVLRGANAVLRIRSLRTNPTPDERPVAVEAEPTAIVISPSGTRLFVANWGQGTVSMLSAHKMAVEETIDLNSVLAASQALGNASPRVGLAHPRALAITDDGDDDDGDETVFATEFFSQPQLDAPRGIDFVDRSRQGFVYPISIEPMLAQPPIPIDPIFETGFVDSDGGMTACFPNQLYAAAVDGSRLHVAAMCTSPRGPLGPVEVNGGVNTANFKTLLHPTIFVIDAKERVQMPEHARVLTRVLSELHEADRAAGVQGGVRMPLIPNDLVFDAGHTAYVSALGADAVFTLSYDALGSLESVGAPGARHVPVRGGHARPIGVAVSHKSPPAFALVASDGSPRLSVVDLATRRDLPSDRDTPPAQDMPERAVSYFSSAENRGRHHFATGLNVWSLDGQAWSSCESCHPDGSSDGVVWHFSRGPRRTLSAANAYEKTSPPSARRRRLLLWGANIDEIHDIEAITRGVSGGVGGMLWRYAVSGETTANCRLLYDNRYPGTLEPVEPCFQAKHTSFLHNGLNGSLGSLERGACDPEDAGPCDTPDSRDWPEIDAFLRSLRAPTAPTRLIPSVVREGRELFVEGGCAGCHGGPGWTISKVFYQPSLENNGALPYGTAEAPLPDALPDWGWLRNTTYDVPEPLRRLNPAAAGGSATLRTVPPAERALELLYDAASAGDEQILCALRDVGTFPSNLTEADARGLVAPGAPEVYEYRHNGRLAQGAGGMNVPSLYGLAVGAPFFHAGNARTLEEIFDSTFAAHYQALAPPGFLENQLTRYDQITKLVAFLLSLDERAELEPVPGGFELCPR